MLENCTVQQQFVHLFDTVLHLFQFCSGRIPMVRGYTYGQVNFYRNGTFVYLPAPLQSAKGHLLDDEFFEINWYTIG